MIETRTADGMRCMPLTSNQSAEPTVSELVSGIADDAQLLIRQQYQMLRAEIQQDIRRTKLAIKYFSVGGAGIRRGYSFCSLPCLCYSTGSWDCRRLSAGRSLAAY